MRPIIVAALALLLTACAHKPGVGSYADAATTYAVVQSPRLIEANPLLSWGNPAQAAGASILIKQVAKEGLTASGVDAAVSHRAVETGGMFGAGWNVAMLAGASHPVALLVGAPVAYLYWRIREP